MILCPEQDDLGLNVAFQVPLDGRKKKTSRWIFLNSLNVLKEVEITLSRGRCGRSIFFCSPQKEKEKVNGWSLKAGQEWCQSVYSGFFSFIDPFCRPVTSKRWKLFFFYLKIELELEHEWPVNEFHFEIYNSFAYGFITCPSMSRRKLAWINSWGVNGVHYHPAENNVPRRLNRLPGDCDKKASWK